MPKLNVDGVNIYFEDAGEGFPVVLSHGYNSNHYEWALQLPLLSRKYRVIAIDHRGHGFSDSPGSPDKYSIPIFAADIRAVLRSLNIEKCHLIGQSMGGFISQQFIKDFPEMVSSLILVSTSAELSGFSDYDKYMRKVHEIARTKGLDAAFEYTTSRDPILKQYL
jgi:3-oxoadipate enol-lactonase